LKNNFSQIFWKTCHKTLILQTTHLYPVTNLFDIIYDIFDRKAVTIIIMTHNFS